VHRKSVHCVEINSLSEVTLFNFSRTPNENEGGQFMRRCKLASELRFPIYYQAARLAVVKDRMHCGAAS
jgi:hypothetical protein